MDIDTADESLQAYERAVGLRRELLAKSPGQSQPIHKLASALNSLGMFYHWRSGDTIQAEVTLAEALNLCEQLVREDGNNPEFRTQLAQILQSLGPIHVPLGKHDIALQYSQRALPLLEQLAQEHPAAPEYQFRLVQTLTAIQVSYHNLRQPENALKLYDRAQPVAEKLAQMHPDVPAYQLALLQLKVLHGGALSQVGEYEKAAVVVEDALKSANHTEILYNAACTYALAANGVKHDAKRSADEQEKHFQKYSQRAMELLNDADRNRVFDAGRALKLLTTDRDFDVLRDRADFQQLVDRAKLRATQSP